MKLSKLNKAILSSCRAEIRKLKAKYKRINDKEKTYQNNYNYNYHELNYLREEIKSFQTEIDRITKNI